MTNDVTALMNRHYSPGDLIDRMLDGLRKAGKDLDRISCDDLAPLDQFHSRGKQATVELAHIAQLRSGTRVLDVGGGLGGPARTLAAEFGCEVTVLDLTEEYLQVGAMLTERTGLSDRVIFRHGSALALPFADEYFDVVWTQHCSMNIQDKALMYGEAHRVLRSAGRLATYEIVAGSDRLPIHIPVPWASDPALSFLEPADEWRALIERAGFAAVTVSDKSHVVREWLRDRMKVILGALPPLGLHLVLGGTFRPAFENYLRNLDERRVAVVEAVFQKIA